MGPLQEEIYDNLTALDNGEVDVKTLIKRYNVRNVTLNLISGRSPNRKLNTLVQQLIVISPVPSKKLFLSLSLIIIAG